MFIIETIIFIFLSSLSLISLAGYGQILISKYKFNFFLSFFFGLIIFSLLITGIHFFIKINIYINLIILIFGIYLFLIKFKFNLDKILKKKYLIFFLIFLFLIPIFLSHKYHEDFGYYHLPYLISLAEQKIIFGLANSNFAYAHNSLWLNIIGIYLLPGNNYNFVLLPTFLVYVIFIFFCFEKILKHSERSISNYFLIISLFYFILKFTRLSEYGNDLPSTIFSIVSIFYFIKYSETSNFKKNIKYFYFNFAFAVFAILIKFSSIPVLFFTIILFINNFKKLFKIIFRIEFLLIYLLSLLFFIQQYFFTGCVIFPFKFSCLDVSWYNDGMLLLLKNIELINKSYFSTENNLTKEEFLTNLNWIPFWLSRNYSEILEHLTIIFFPPVLLLIFSNKYENRNFLKFENKKLLFLFILISFSFWFKFSPVYRFSIPYFISLIFVLTVSQFVQRKFSKKTFITLFCIAITFNFSKNIIRVLNKDNIFYGIEKINNRFVVEEFSKNNFIDVYKPDVKNNKNGWQGRLCWDIPFFCTYNKINVNKKNGYLIISK